MADVDVERLRSALKVIGGAPTDPMAIAMWLASVSASCQRAFGDLVDALPALLDAAEERAELVTEIEATITVRAEGESTPIKNLCASLALTVARLRHAAEERDRLRQWNEDATAKLLKCGTTIATLGEDLLAARAQLDAVERAYSLALLGSLPGRHGDRSIQPLHWKALGDAIRTAPKAPTTKEENLMPTTSTKLATAMDLLGRASSYFADNEAAPDARWHREFFLLSGDHMILTEDGWTHGADKGEYEPGDILDEVNVPKAPTTTPTEEPRG